jgi:hypothetical protein
MPGGDERLTVGTVGEEPAYLFRDLTIGGWPRAGLDLLTLPS